MSPIAPAKDATCTDAWRESSEHYELLLRQALEKLPVGVWVTDARGRILLANAAGERTRTGAASRYDRRLAQSGLERALHGGQTSLRERAEVPGPNGCPGIILHSAFPLYNGLGRIVGAVAVHEEISAHPELEGGRRRGGQLRILARAAGHINEVLDEPVILRRLVQSALRLVRASVGAAGLLHEGRLVFLEYCDRGRWLPAGCWNEAGHAISGWVVTHGMCYVTNNIEHCPLAPAGCCRPRRNLVAAPISGRNGQMLGCLELRDALGGRPFDTSHAEILQILAAAAGTALENARLLHQRDESRAELRESEERYRRLLDFLPEAVAVHTTERILYVNQAALRMLGASRPEQLQGRSPLEFVHPDCHGRATRRLQNLLDTSLEPPPLEEKLVRLDGSLLDAEIRSTITTFQHQRALQTVFRDITAQKRAEEGLSRLAAIVQDSDAAIIGKDLEGNITSWNRSAARLFGYSLEEALGRHVSMLMPPSLRERFPDDLERVRNGNAVQHEPSTAVRKDGSEVAVSLSISPVHDADGRLIGFSIVARDITERQKAEEEIRSANRRLRQLSGQLLRSQDEERRRLARELHDSTAQNLAALSMNLSLLARPDTVLDEPGRKLLAEAEKLADQCSRDVRAISYLLHPPLLDTLGLLAALRSYVEGFARRTGIDVELRIPADFGRARAEVETTLFRIAQESLLNIHRHSGSRHAALRLERFPNQVRMSIADDGCGIPPAARSVAPGDVPLGVGILGMRERASELGGELHIDSNSGGTTVVVTLPLETPA